MKLQEGVHLHFLPTTKFTTNHIKIRFAAPLDSRTIAGRVLVANILEMANQDYPTPQLFQRKLAELYGAHYSTTVSKRGKVHFVDITVSYVTAQQLPDKMDLTPVILDILYASLFRPLLDRDGFAPELFEIEKQNLLHYLEAEIEDHFYHADVELHGIFFQEEALRIPRVGRVDLVEKETAQSVYQAFCEMLQLDQIDIFVMGQVDEPQVIERFKFFPFSYRKPKLSLEYQQPFSNVVREKIEKKEATQSILEVAYHLQVLYNDVNYAPLLVLNGLFGSFSHSKLFVQVREKEGLAYTIGSQVNIFSGILKVYAGIDAEKRQQTLKLINKQLLDIKRGNFSEQDIDLTKKMLIHSATLAQDRQTTLIEQAYNEVVLEERYLSWQEWIDAVNQVSRQDIIRVARLVRLQAIYFMEGVAK